MEEDDLEAWIKADMEWEEKFIKRTAGLEELCDRAAKGDIDAMGMIVDKYVSGEIKIR